MQAPAIHGNRIVFTYEGDLWSVGTEGGLAVLMERTSDQADGPFNPLVRTRQ